METGIWSVKERMQYSTVMLVHSIINRMILVKIAWCVPYAKTFISSAGQIMKEEIVKILWQIHPFNNWLKFLYKITLPGTWTLQSCENLDHCPICNKFLIISNLHTPWQIFLFPDRW